MNNDLSLKFRNHSVEISIPLCDKCHRHGVLPYRMYSYHEFQFFELKTVPIIDDVLRICRLYEQQNDTLLDIQLCVVF
jgi:hypothetical protein